MNPELWKLILAFGGLFIGTVTAPIMWAIKAESNKHRAELNLLKAEIKADLTALEARLNERIDTRLVHR